MWDDGFPDQSLCIPGSPLRSRPEGTRLCVLELSWILPCGQQLHLPAHMGSVEGGGCYCVEFNVKQW